MFRFALTRAVVLVGGTAALALAGCTPSSPDEPTASPSMPVVSASPSVTVAPSETALSEEELLELIPAEARTEDFPGAAAFAAFFVSEYYRMFAEQDPQLFKFMSGDKCVFCASSLDSYDELIGAGGSREGGEVIVDPTTAEGSLSDDGYWYVALRHEALANTDRDSEGNVVESVGPSSGTSYFRLSWDGSRWVMVDVDVDEE